MNNLYAKATVVKLPRAVETARKMSSIDLGFKDAVASVEASGMRTLTSQTAVAEIGEGPPSATALLTALNRYHDQDCERYRPYNPNLGAIRFEIETGLGDLNWTMNYRYVRSGKACVLQNDFSSTPLGIRTVNLQGCTEKSADIYSCDLRIGFECPVRGVYSDVPMVGQAIARMCHVIDEQWAALISANVHRDGLSWKVMNHAVMRVLP
jgi:hypothetical protein